MIPRLVVVVGEQMTLPGVTDVDTGRTESLSAQTAMRFRTEATLRAEQVERESQAPPRTAPWWRGKRRVRIEWNEWEFGTIQVGALVGTAVNVATGDHLGYVPCAAGGAVVMYAWGWWRWWDENRPR
jgi:hypothetical protein